MSEMSGMPAEILTNLTFILKGAARFDVDRSIQMLSFQIVIMLI